MSTAENPDHLARCEQLLQAAEAYERVEDWDNAVAQYRALNELDHLYKGAEAKLLFAVRERDCFGHYTAGKAHMAAGRYAEARAEFQKAKARGGVYKDTNTLIKQCDEHVAGATAPTPSPTSAAKKGCLGMVLLFLPVHR